MRLGMGSSDPIGAITSGMAEMPHERKTIAPKVRFAVFRRDRFTCQYCGRFPPNVVLEVDHVLPVSLNGGNNVENLVTACLACNRGKGSEAETETGAVIQGAFRPGTVNGFPLTVRVVDEVGEVWKDVALLTSEECLYTALKFMREADTLTAKASKKQAIAKWLLEIGERLTAESG